VILNGDSSAPTRVVEGVVQYVAPTTAEQRLERKNELKARGTLLMALPNKHQLKFNIHNDAKILMEAIEKRFGGNKESKKDSYPHWRNKTDLEEQSLDDLLNSLKIYEAEVKSSSFAINSTQNIAFVSSNTDNTNEPVSDVASVSAASAKIPVYALPNVDTLSNTRTRRNLGANGSTSMGFDMSKVEYYNCHMKGHFAKECRSPKVTRRNVQAKPQRRNVLVETSTSNALVSQYDGFTSFMFDFDELFTSETDDSLPASPNYDRSHSEDGYHVVPPPFTGTFMPPKPDLVFHDAPNVNETAHTAFNVEPSPTKPDKELSHMPSTPIIEDWVSDSEDDSEPKLPQNAPSFVQPTKQVQTPRPSIKPVETSIPAANPKTAIPKPKIYGNGKNRKACFSNPQHALKDKGVINSGCSMHMTRNMFYLSDFEEINGGYVVFGGNPKGCKIFGKGKIRTEKLDFDDNYFVKELKFNLFSVSQMCDKKHSFLFTDTECIVLSPEFKLPNENQVLLRVPRENNMYNVDLKNIVPTGDLTCLVTPLIFKRHLAEGSIDVTSQYNNSNHGKRLEKRQKFQTSSKNLSQLLASQTNDKTELGYNAQGFTSFMFDCDELFTSETDDSLPASPNYDRSHSGDGYHVVPPPFTGTFMPPKPDLVFHDAPNVNETVHTVFNVEPSPTKPDKELSHMPSTPIIEDWVSDSEDDSEPELPQNAPSFVQPTEQVQTPRPSIKPVETSIPAANPKTAIPKPKIYGNGRNRKACFVSKLTKSKLVSMIAARPVTAAVPKTHVTKSRQAKTIVTKPHSPPRRYINRILSPKASNFLPKVTAVKASMSNPQHALKDKGVINSGCSMHMMRNMFYLSDFEEINGGYVAFGGNPKGGKIFGKGKIRTGKLDFDDVYFVKELKFNLFSVSQMCDKKHSVLFTDTECIVLSLKFKLPNENQVLLRVPRENNMYNVDLKNIVSTGDLTCLFAKARLDESNLWHRRLGHINFKTMNKLIKGNLVRGLPTKVCKNNHTDVACKKGKQHKASSKTKPFCAMKGIKREFSVPRTPQQNGIAERKNRTLIEAAKTMLADLLLPIPFWAEAVNTPCYVQNRVLVTKPRNKTPYELLHGRTPSIGFMRPFGCPVTILNTLDSLGKFDENEHEFKGRKHESKVHIFPSSSAQKKKHDDKTKREAKGKSHVESSTGYGNLSADFKDFSDNSINEVNAADTSVPIGGRIFTNSTNIFSAVGPSNAAVSPIHGKSSYMDTSQLPDDPNMPALEDITYFDDEEDVGTEADFTNLKIIITKVWVLVDLPNRKRAIGTKWVFRNKNDERGIVVKNKARLVTQGHTQEEGIDYEKVFAPVARIEAIRVFLAYATFMGFMVYQMDVKSAFLYGTIEEEVCVCQPLGFEDPDYPNKVYKVVKALYGLHQAPRAWYETLANYLLENGFQRGKIDQTLFIKRQQESIYCLPNEEIFTKLARMGYEKPSTKLTFYKAFFSSQWKFLIHTILQCMSAKRTAWNEFSSSMALAVSEECGQFIQVLYKVFANMRRVGKGFSVVETPLFEGMIKAQQVGECATEVNVDDVPAAGVANEDADDGGITELIDADKDVGLENVENKDDADVQGRPAESQAQIYQIDLEHVDKVLSIQDDDIEPAELKEVVEVVTTAKLKTEVVTVAAATITVVATAAAPTLNTAPSTARRKKGVVIRDPEETSTPSIIIHYKLKSKDKVKGIMVHEPKPLKKKTQIEQDKAYVRELEAKLNKNIDWDKTKEQMKEEDSRALKRKIESSEDKATKKKKLDEEVKELRKHLQIVPNDDDDDDVYTEATSLALKVLVVDYEIYTEHNKPYYKIKRADGLHQLYLSFFSMLRNFDREDLDVLWKLVKERFASTKPKNFPDDFLLTTLGAMFEKPDVQAQIWRNQRSFHGLAKVKSWKLLEFYGV
nr:retrovirus-related Pol polyprotein from transposon TNT 1-94 [Tanacetum cinerariifolium]